MKKAVVFLFLFAIYSFNLYAEENYQTVLQLARTEDINNIVKKENALEQRIISAFYKTGKKTLTIKEVQIEENYPFTEFTNYQNQACGNDGTYCNGSGGISFTFNFTDTRLYINNVMGSVSRLSEYELDKYSNNANKSERSVTNNQNGRYFVFTDTMRKFVKIVEEVESNSSIVMQKNSPSDTTKTHYRPNGDGTVNVFTYNSATASWQDLGVVGGTSDECLGYFNTFDELKNVVATEKTCAEVTSAGGKIKRYYYVGGDIKEWQEREVAGSGEGTTFNGDSNIIEMSTTLLKKAGNSKARSSAPNGEFSGTLEFTKIDNTTTGGYWVDPTNMYVVAGNLAGLKSQTWAENAIGFYFDKKLYTLKRMNVPGVGVKWVYLANGFDDVSLNFDAIDNGSGGYVFDNKNTLFFKKAGNVWTSLDNTFKKLTSHSDRRAAFTLIDNKYTYYVTNSDCSSTTCNGLSTNGYYAGKKFDNMFVFYVGYSGKRKHNLLDAIPRNSIAEMYDNADVASLYNNYIYFRAVDTKNRAIYKRSDGKYFSRAGVQIPNVLMVGGIPNLPNDYQGSNISFSADAIIFDSLDKVDNWIDAPHLAKIVYASKVLTHNTASNKNFYTDNNSGDGQASATIIYSAYGRSKAPLIQHNGVKVYTKQLCTDDATCPKNNGLEPRYTDNGVLATDSNFAGRYRWFHSSTGKITSNLLDAIPCNANYGSQEMDDQCYDLSPVIITLDGKVIDNVPNYFASRTKHCLEWNTSYKIFQDWRPAGQTYTASNPNGWRWGSCWRLTCKRGSATRYFYQDSGNIFCPSNWSYVTHVGASGTFTQGTSADGRTPYTWKANCNEVGADVWYK